MICFKMISNEKCGARACCRGVEQEICEMSALLSLGLLDIDLVERHVITIGILQLGGLGFIGVLGC